MNNPRQCKNRRQRQCNKYQT